MKILLMPEVRRRLKIPTAMPSRFIGTTQWQNDGQRGPGVEPYSGYETV